MSETVSKPSKLSPEEIAKRVEALSVKHQPEQKEDVLIRYKNGTANGSELVDEIVSTICDDCNLARPLALVMSNLVREEMAQTSNRPLLPQVVKKLQSLYKELDTLEKLPLPRWLAIVSIICACFETFRNTDKSPMLLPLVKPIILSLATLTNFKISPCTDASSNDFNQEIRIRSLFAHLQILGKELDMLNQVCLDGLYDKIRVCFLNDGCSEQVRLMLMELIEVRAGGWSLSNSAYSYYYGQASK